MQISFKESLENVGKVLPVVEDMVIKKFYSLKTKRLSEMEDIIRFITIYVSLQGDDDIRLSKRRTDTLAYYIMYGYSKETKDMIKKKLKIEKSNLNNLNSKLRAMGYLVAETHNTNNNNVNEELLNFVKFMVLNKGEYFLVKMNG